MARHPKHLPSEERQAATIQTVITLLAKHHPGELTTTIIAQHMGLTQGALFKHFPTKDAIFQTVMEWIANTLLSRLERAIEGIESAPAALEAMFMTHAEFAAHHPGIPRMMFGELQKSRASPTRTIAKTLLLRYRVMLIKLMQQGIANHEFPSTLDMDAAATLFIGMLQGLIMQAVIAEDMEQLQKQAPGVFSIFLAGITHPESASAATS